MGFFKKRRLYRNAGILILIAAVAAISLGCLRKPPDVLVTSQSKPIVASKLDDKIIQLVTDSYIPYGFEENGVLKGVAVDIVQEMFKRRGYTVELQMLPWTRALQMVQDGDADGIFCAFYSDERAVYLDYMQEPLAYEAMYCYSLKNSSVRFDGTLESLGPYRVGVIQDWFYGEPFEQAVKNGDLHVQKVTDLSINIQKLLDGRIDVVLNPRAATQYYLKQMAVQDQIVEQPALFRDPTGLYLGFAKKRLTDQELVREMDAALLEMKKDGTYQKIVDRYTQ